VGQKTTEHASSGGKEKKGKKGTEGVKVYRKEESH